MHRLSPQHTYLLKATPPAAGFHGQATVIGSWNAMPTAAGRTPCPLGSTRT